MIENPASCECECECDITIFVKFLLEFSLAMCHVSPGPSSHDAGTKL